MMLRLLRPSRSLAALLAVAACVAAHAAGTVGTSFPADFPAIEDTSLGKPVIGFGASGVVARVPVIFLHGNNDTPFPTACNPFGRVQAFAQYLADRGYSTSELWRSATRATSATWRQTRPIARASRTRPPPTCPT